MMLLLTACSSYDLNAKADTGYSNGADYGADTAEQGGGGGAGDTGFSGEDENDYLKMAPAATDVYVFVANPDRNTVTRIAVDDLSVVTAEVGDTPSTVVTTADYSTAVTLNEGSDSVSILDAATMTVREVGIRDNFNRLALSDDGHWVMAWYDPDAESLGTTGGAISFNEASFVDVVTGTHYPMAVGFNPHDVKWTRDGSRAVVVSDNALAVVDLTAATPSPTMITLDDEGDAPPAAEVVLSPDGHWAFVRQEGSDALVVVSLDDQSVSSVTADEGLSDIDLNPSGTSLAAVARTARKVLEYDPTDPFALPTWVDFPFDQPFGSLQFTGDGALGVLYTNASAVAEYGVWDVGAGTMTEHKLEKPVSTLGLSQDGDSVIIFHTKGDAPDADPDSPFYGEWAVTMTDLSSNIQNPILLDAEPTAYTVSENGAYGYFIMDGESYLEVLDYATLLHDNVELPSAPKFIGNLPGRDLAYASQEHPLGRISFYDPESGGLDTITGFELNSEIDHE